MSFILDALRKSESERRRDTTPTLAQIPVAAPRGGLPTWVWAVIGALSLCVLVLAGAWWRSMQPPADGSDEVAAAEHGESARGTLPAAIRAAPPVPESPAGGAALPGSLDAVSRPDEGVVLPSVADMRAAGIALPPLELQLLSYSENAAERFVFINGYQYRQGQRVQNGPVIVGIYPGRVVLRQQGLDFILVPN